MKDILSKIPHKPWIRTLSIFTVVALLALVVLLPGCKTKPDDKKPASSGQTSSEDANVPAESGGDESDPSSDGDVTSDETDPGGETPEEPGDEEEPGEPDGDEEDDSSQTAPKPFEPDLNFNAKKGVSVLQLGAVGDGKHDDTQYFREAVQMAQLNGLQVYVPAGTYRLTETLSLNNTNLIGYSVTSWPADKPNLPTIVIDHDTGPGFEITQAAISGVRLLVGKPNEKYPAIECVSTTTLTYVGISNAVVAINMPHFLKDGDPNRGRSDIEYVDIDNVSKTGMFISGTLDAAEVKNVRVTSTNTDFAKAGVGLDFYQNDGVKVSGCYVSGANVAYRFSDMENVRSAWGQYSNNSADNVNIGIQISSGVPTRRTYYTVWNGGTLNARENAVKVTKGRIQLSMFDAILTAKNGPCVSLTGGETLQFNRCNITTSANQPAVVVDGSLNTIVNSCKIVSAGTGVKLTAANQNVVISGNSITAPGGKFADAMPNSAQKVLTGNT